MYVKSLTLQNFRAFESLSIEFKPGMNVIAGVNGAGKTSLLLGLLPPLSWWGSSLTNNFPIVGVSETDVRKVPLRVNNRTSFETKFPVRSIAAIQIGEEVLEYGEEYSNSSMKSELKWPTSKFSDAERMPLMVFYRANRKWSDVQKINETQVATSQDSRFVAYDRWSNATDNHEKLYSWVFVKTLERQEWALERGVGFDDVHDDDLATLNQTLRDAIPESFHSLAFSVREKNIVVKRSPEDNGVLFNQLSDGERAFICLFADLAQRACQLNPALGTRATQETPGVVLIDEVDEHLHPKWQRQIVTGLIRAFPCIQFIVTTHSPQVLGEVPADQIYLLSNGGVTQPVSSVGRTSDEVLIKLMGASEVNLEFKRKTDEIYEAINNEQFNMARELLSNLDETYGETEAGGKLGTLIRLMDAEEEEGEV